MVLPEIPCSFAFSSNSLIEISFLSASSSLISFAPVSVSYTHLDVYKRQVCLLSAGVSYIGQAEYCGDQEKSGDQNDPPGTCH